MVIAADGPNAAEVDRITLRADDGRTLELIVGRLDLSSGGLNAAHLREHLLTGEPITVFYYDHEVIRYVDAVP